MHLHTGGRERASERGRGAWRGRGTGGRGETCVGGRRGGREGRARLKPSPPDSLSGIQHVIIGQVVATERELALERAREREIELERAIEREIELERAIEREPELERAIEREIELERARER